MSRQSEGDLFCPHGLGGRSNVTTVRAWRLPSPHLITQAVEALDAELGECALVGDSVTDIQGAHLAGTHSIGYANKPGKRERLSEAGASAIINSLADLALRLLSLRTTFKPGP